MYVCIECKSRLNIRSDNKSSNRAELNTFGSINCLQRIQLGILLQLFLRRLLCLVLWEKVLPQLYQAHLDIVHIIAEMVHIIAEMVDIIAEARNCLVEAASLDLQV
jgi:hypothetical protein